MSPGALFGEFFSFRLLLYLIVICDLTGAGYYDDDDDKWRRGGFLFFFLRVCVTQLLTPMYNNLKIGETGIIFEASLNDAIRCRFCCPIIIDF